MFLYFGAERLHTICIVVDSRMMTKIFFVIQASAMEQSNNKSFDRKQFELKILSARWNKRSRINVPSGTEQGQIFTANHYCRLILQFKCA